MRKQNNINGNAFSPSLYLAQSYQDACADYDRSLTSQCFPVWDYVILTASNEHQAESYRLQIESRRDRLPARTQFSVIPDEGGARIGSGGATLSVLKYLKEQAGRKDGWKEKRILVIHSGGDSRRVPQYSALGKLFCPVPHVLPDGRSSTLFDELIIAMSSVPGRMKEGMLFLSGDVLLLFNPLLIDWSGSGAAVISFKEHVETGKNHGVYLRGADGNVKSFLHKQPRERLQEAGAVNHAGDVDIDTGMILFGTDILDSLWSLVSSKDAVDAGKYNMFVNDKVRLSLYGDFQYPLASDSTLEGFYKEKPEGELCSELMICRKAIWNALRPYRLKLLRMAPAKFVHFGTTSEVLELFCSCVKNYGELGWNTVINSSAVHPSYNSVIAHGATVGKGAYAEVSYIHSSATVGDGSVLSYIELSDVTVPPHVVLHGLKQVNGKFVCRIFGTNDNPKSNQIFGRELPAEFGGSLWNAPLYPEKESIRDAVIAALNLYSAVISEKWDKIERGKSLAAGFSDADPFAILAWNKRMSELVAMNNVASLVDDNRPAREGRLATQLTKVQAEWLQNRLSRADYRAKMRLLYYVGTAIGGVDGEKHISRAFRTLSEAILASRLQDLQENNDARICKDYVELRLPLRVNWGGGWSDTPPYCNENGGTVLNTAILLNDDWPVHVRLRRIPEYKIVFSSADIDTHGEFDDITPLQSVSDPFDPFVLQKAALLACGVIPVIGGNLKNTLERIGGGIWLDTEVTGVPRGSGLGTSSILAAACLKSLFEFLGISHTEGDIYSRVLCMEQVMSTGGGWQDQVGGVTNGIKYITSKPGLQQELSITYLSLSPSVSDELNERFSLIYTGQRRLARNLLRDVVGRYIGNEPDAVYALNEIQKMATLMRFELERGYVDEFAKLLSEHWKLSKMIDTGSTNTLIDQIFDSIKDLTAGHMICGAGGGGFLQVVLRSGTTKEELQGRLKKVFSDTDINVWNAALV